MWKEIGYNRKWKIEVGIVKHGETVAKIALMVIFVTSLHVL